MLLFSACSTIPKGATAVKNFDKDKYLGKWYEIARLDFKFERDLNNTTAEYSLMDNGKIKVDNRGFNTKTKEWKQAIGIALDSEYRYALIAGKDLSYLWILARETTIPESIKQDYLSIARKLGYKTEELIWVEHN